MVRMILKEIGGRGLDAAGSINSPDNMFKGSSGNSLGGKIVGDENKNPVMGSGGEVQSQEVDYTPSGASNALDGKLKNAGGSGSGNTGGGNAGGILSMAKGLFSGGGGEAAGTMGDAASSIASAAG